jgi:hypothetical protein
MDGSNTKRFFWCQYVVVMASHGQWRCHPSGPGHMCDLIGVPIMASLEGCRLDELEILPNGNMVL